MIDMPKAFPAEFRRDVVAVARKREGSIRQIAKDFGVSESCLNRWLQQADVEDLLGAALNLSIEQSYLDVHYRSRNADLIEFSNEHFYGSRLQPIPGSSSGQRVCSKRR